MEKLTYRYSSIQSVNSLCSALGIQESRLRYIAQNAPSMYIGPMPRLKKNGDYRYVFDTNEPLKSLLKKINSVFFKKIYYPKYLTGSLSGCDFVSNVDLHKGSLHVITEDISSFFDNISEEHVKNIWRKIFFFSEDVSVLLTKLTTKDGKVFQGTPTSSYIANLVFWEYEHKLVTCLATRGIRYSRYVDDIIVSSVTTFKDSDKSWAISNIYGMMHKLGFKPKRAKHQSLDSSSPITLMGLNANSMVMPTLTQRERGAIRAQVFQLENRFKSGEVGPLMLKSLNQAAGKVGRLSRLHEKEGNILKLRLTKIRHELNYK